MAFHPFRHFRKHQKAYFAVLILLCMVTFVFSGFGSSGADPFYNIMQWIGLSRSHGDEVLPLYGKTIRTDDLDKVRMNRQLASEFLKFGIIYASPLDSVLSDIRKKVERERKGAPEALPDPVQMAFQEWEKVSREVRSVGMGMGSPEGLPRQIEGSLQFVQGMYANPEVQKNGDQRRAIDAIMTALAFQAWVMNPARPPQEYYFSGTPRTEDLLDFLVWKHEADRLGIVLTPADVCREVNRAWGNGDFIAPEGKFEANEWVRKFLGTNRVHKNLGPQDLMQALTDEFRVAIAKEAVLGDGVGPRYYRTAVDGIHHSPAIATPDEFLRYFQQQRTTLAVSLLPIPVEKFKEKVERRPSPEDLRNLYARYKDDEPSPARRQPGFKEARRIKVEYFSFRPSGPFAKKLAARATELLPLFRVGAAANTFPAGGGLAWAAAIAAPVDLDAALHAQYEDYRREESDRTLKYDGSDGVFPGRFGQGLDPTNQKAAEAQAAAALVGQLLGEGATGGTPLGAAAAPIGTRAAYERAATSMVASTVLAAASPSPLVAATLPARYLHSPRPYEAVHAKMVERFEETLARRSMESGILHLRTEMEKLISSHSDKLDEFMKKAVADYGLENFRSMGELQTRQEMIDRPDPVLNELRTAYAGSRDNPFAQFQFGAPQKKPDFVDAMFHAFELSPIERQFGIQRPIKTQQFHASSGDETWVFWRSEDKPAHVRPYEKVEKLVRDAWFTEQARKLARKEAERIESALKEQHPNAEDAVKYLRDQKQGDVFELTNVAHLVSPIFNLPGHKSRPDDYHPYQPPADRIAYPPADLVDRLLTLKKPGEALVLADQPVRHYYVAVLMTEPQVPSNREFYDIYSFSGTDNRLWMDMMNARRRAYYKKVMEQLRSDATKNLEGGEYVIPENVKNRGESSGDMGE